MKFKEGDSVEVLKRNDDELYDSWFPAKILSVHWEKYTVQCELFQNIEGKIVKELVDAEDVRPCQPSACRKERWNVGDIVEVFDLHSWRAGRIAKVLKNEHIVARIFGSIQLKEFHISNIRFRQTWQKNQWVTVDQASGEKQLECGYNYISSQYAKELDQVANQVVGEEVCDQKFKRTHVGCISPVRTIRKNLSSRSGFFPCNALKGTNKKRKASSRTDELHPQTRSEFPRKVSAVNCSKNAVIQYCRHKSVKHRIVRHSQVDDKDYRDNNAIYSSSVPAQVTEEDNECSVASCSGNDLAGYTNTGIRKHSKGYVGDWDDAMSSCPSENGQDDRSVSEDELAANIHELELRAYRSTMQALHASGPLSWEQESLLTNLRLSLNISNEEHLLQLRHLLST